MKANSKLWLYNDTVLAIITKNKFFKKFKCSGLETDTDNVKAAKAHPYRK